MKQIFAVTFALVAAMNAISTARAQSNYEPYAITTIAGSPGLPGSSNGTGSAARFSFPAGVAVDGAANVYVADAFNYTIRKIGPGGAVSTLAGLTGQQGSADGTGSTARFNAPTGVAADGAGNVYVADFSNNTIRKISSDGVVSTLAGQAGASGSDDGSGNAARFNHPYGVAVDGAGNVYVADENNHTIRKITAGGVVSTLAGLAGTSGSADGVGSAARFKFPDGVAVDTAGNVYVGDMLNDTVRKITSGGVVTTMAGAAGVSGSADGTGSEARFNFPKGVAVDGAGNVYVADTNNSIIRKITPGGVTTTLAGVPFAEGSADGAGSSARFSDPIGIAVSLAGNLYVGDTYSFAIRLGIGAQFGNISTRASAGTNDNVLIGGFIVTGESGTGKNVLIRGVGPSLNVNGVPVAGRLNNPLIELHEPDGTVVTNDNWREARNAGDIPANLQPSDDRESAILTTLAPGAYTVIAKGVSGETGIALVEAYDLNQASPAKLANISTRGFVQTGDDVMIGGFIVRGPAGSIKTMVIRGIGPSLNVNGVPVAGRLGDPLIELHKPDETVVTNDNWRDARNSGEIPTTLQPSNDLESAILTTLAPGAYTVIVKGVNRTTGIGLVEVYQLGN